MGPFLVSVPGPFDRNPPVRPFRSRGRDSSMEGRADTDGFPDQEPIQEVDNVNYQPLWGVAGGAAGVVAMTMLMRIAVSSGMTQMRMPLILGGMFTRDRAQARRIGLMAHMVNGLIFGLAYAAVWWWWDLGAQGVGTGVWVGAAIGAVHGLIAVMMMPMMGRLHSRAVEPYPASERTRERQRVAVGGTAAAKAAPQSSVQTAPSSDEVRLPAHFGVGGSAFGRRTPMGLLAAHLLFGAVWGVVFAALA
jgi:hypothetical protein